LTLAEATAEGIVAIEEVTEADPETIAVVAAAAEIGMAADVVEAKAVEAVTVVVDSEFFIQRRI
jgi:hypothetical protein